MAFLQDGFVNLPFSSERLGGAQMRFSPRLRHYERRLATKSIGAWLVSASVVLALGLWSFGAILLSTMKSNELTKALQASDNMVSTMSNDIARNLDMFDLSLRAVIDNMNYPGVDSVSKDIRQMVLFDRAATAKYLASIKVLDESGRMTFDSRTAAPANKNYSTRDYFLVHHDNPNIGLYIGHPFVGGSGKYRIGISRRLSRADGSLAGIVVGTMELDYFQDMFSRVIMSPGSVLALTHANGTMLMRNPVRKGDIGRDMSQSELFTLAKGTASGQFESVGSTDGVRRLYSYRRVGDYPLLIVSGISTADALAGWRHYAMAIGAILLVLGFATIALAVFASRELRRREIAEARLRILATTDALTQIRNRRGFENAATYEWNEALSTETPVALLMIDVDHFKKFNDQHGHQAGDRALVTIGRILNNARRSDRDVVARYGGEEFAMVLPATSPNDAFQVAEAIRESVALAGVQEDTQEGAQECHENGSSLPTVSIGVSSQVPNLPDASDILIAAADCALYKAKLAGRNRTVADDSSLGRGLSPRLAA
jgi:diguanylate cyclase (GGDEF)-like protein